MNETPASDVDASSNRPTLANLFIDLMRDANSFARAEMIYLKAQAGERAQYAVPGIIMIGVAIAIAMGVLMAVPVALILLLAPQIGMAWALGVVTLAGLVLAAILIQFGVRRIKSVFKRPENR